MSNHSKAQDVVAGDPRWIALVDAFIEVMFENRQDAGVLEARDAPMRSLRLPLSANSWWSWEPRDGELDLPPRKVALAAYEDYRRQQKQ